MMIDAVDINDDGEIDYSEFLVSSLTQPYKKNPKTSFRFFYFNFVHTFL